MQNLEEYRRKRNFQRTPEPAGAKESTPAEEAHEGGQFVIQKHAARRLHYDLRLERDGVFKSWAVPKGPSLKPGEKRLAVRVEDHPLEYGDFEGVIPEKEYGGGTVMLWDRGRWAAVEHKGKRRHKADEDHIDFVLVGEKLRGAWTLVRTSGRSGDADDNWLLIKRRDSAAAESRVTDLSVATGRTMEQIAADRNRTWTRAGEVDAQTREVPDPASLPGARKKALAQKPEAELATLVRETPAGDDWLHEIKFDGYRILARCEGGSIRLISRNGKDWTQRFPETAALLANLAGENALLDGEIVIMAADGTTSFRALQEALAVSNTRSLVYQAFDLVHLNGYNLMAVPLATRKRALADLLAASGFTGRAGVRYSEHVQGQGPMFMEHACRLGLEGILCKRADSRYRSGRTRDWLKVKCTAREELVVCGYTEPGGTRTGFGSLLLSAWDGNKLVYTGRVGTGFSGRVLAQLHARLRELEIDECPLTEPLPERGLHWVRPLLVAEVEFTEWTRDGVLRHPVFRGLREDRDSDEIRLPEGVRAGERDAIARPNKIIGRGRRGAARDTAEVAGVTLTNAGRILYPEEGITKLGLAQFYEEIEPWLLPQLAFRPLALVRCPEGYTEECFFQKHPGSNTAKGIPRMLIDEKGGQSPYLYVRALSDVIGLVQTGALELHVWGCHVDDVEHPDILVFDLDPAPGVPLSEILRVARELRDRLTGLGLESFPRTTGGKGLHLVVPVVPERGWDEVKAFCHAVARMLAREDKRVTSNMAKSKRRGRIFIDYLRNGRSATAIASYSTRARPGAPVAVPVAWDELTEALRPDRYNVENLRRRLTVLREDPWQGFEAARQRLTAKMWKTVGLNDGDIT